MIQIDVKKILSKALAYLWGLFPYRIVHKDKIVTHIKNYSRPQEEDS